MSEKQSTWETCARLCSHRCRERIDKDADKLKMYEDAFNQLKGLFGDDEMSLSELVSHVEIECYYASLG